MKTALLATLIAAALAGGWWLWKGKPAPRGDPAGVLAAKLEGRFAQGEKLLLVVADGSAGADLLKPPALFAPREEESPLLVPMMSAVDPGAVAWTLGQDRLGEEAVRELSAALISAAEAGVRVDVLAQGRAAAPVLKAVAGLSGKARVHRLVALGMNLDHLKAADPAFFRGFSRPENLEEWAGLWADGKHPPHVELFFKGRSAIRYPAFPRDADALAVEPERALRLAVLLLRAGSTMEDVLEQSLKPEGGEEAVEEGEPPVTCGDYKRCVRAGACEPEPCVNLGDQDAPCMYRDEKGAYCKWLKGGREWSNVSARCRAAFRGGVRPQFRFDQSFGFRCGPA